ncbi:MAG TPA: hypothetical protein VFI65_29980 [Streptosporangiaceae bacterium]|nr:hypothetical protein [Streptosporangiaceae bacterium]
MNGQGLRRRLSRLLVTSSALTATLCAGAGAGIGADAALAAPQAPHVSGGTIKICQCTTFIAADPNNNTLWLVNGKAKSISVVSEKTRKVITTIKLAAQLGSNSIGNLAVDPTSKTVWDFAGSVLVEISDQTMKVKHIFKPQSYRSGFAGVADPARGEVWVTSEETIQGISESTGKVLITLFIADGAKADTIVGLAADPKTGTVFAEVNKFGGTRTWLVGDNEANGFASVRKFPGSSAGLVVDPSAGTVWVLKSNVLNGYSATGKHKSAGSIAISPSRSGGMAADPSTGSIWMASVSGKQLTRISESQRKVIKTLPLPGRSFGITVDTKSHTVFTLNRLNGVIQFYRY